MTLSVNDPNEPFRHMECEVIDVGHADNVLSVSCREVDEIVRANKELSRLRAANGHLEQELQVLRSREMDADDLADYTEDRKQLVTRIDSLKSANRELVEVLDEIGGLSRALRVGGPDPMDLEGLSNALTTAVDLANAAIAKHGETNE